MEFPEQLALRGGGGSWKKPFPGGDMDNILELHNPHWYRKSGLRQSLLIGGFIAVVSVDFAIAI